MDGGGGGDDDQWDDIPYPPSPAQRIAERVQQTQAFATLFQNRSNVLRVGLWLLMNVVLYAYAAYVWEVVIFRHPFVVTSVWSALALVLGGGSIAFFGLWRRGGIFPPRTDQRAMAIFGGVCLASAGATAAVAATLKHEPNFVHVAQSMWAPTGAIALLFVDLAAHSLAPAREPWLARGGVNMINWRMLLVLALLMLSAILGAVPPVGTDGDVKWGYAFGMTALLCALTAPLLKGVEWLVAPQPNGRPHTTTMGVIVATCATSVLVLLIPTVVADRHTGAWDAAYSSLPDAGYIAFYLIFGGALAFAYLVCAVRALERIGYVHFVVSTLVALGLARFAALAFMADSTHLAWFSVVGTLLLLVSSGLYLRACISAVVTKQEAVDDDNVVTLVESGGAEVEL